MGHVIVHALGHMPLFAGRAGHCRQLLWRHNDLGTLTLNLEHPPTFNLPLEEGGLDGGEIY